jgi:hypothetical protein
VQVILTPTAVADKFGVGLNGFADSVPGPPTQLSEQWFDSVQMEIVNVLVGQGIALDGLQFDQLKQAIDDYAFLDPTITSTLTVDAGAALYIANGGGFVLQNGSTFAVEANVSLFASDNTWVWGSSTGNDWTIHGDVTLGTDGTNLITALGKFASGVEFVGTVLIVGALTTEGAVQLGNDAADGTTVFGPMTCKQNVTIETTKILTGEAIDLQAATGYIAPGEVRFYSDASPSSTTGVMQFFGRGVAVGLSSVAKRIAIPFDDYVVDLTGTVSGTATGASVTVTLLTGDVVYVTASADLWNSGTGQVIVFEIVIDGAIQNSPGNLRSEVALDPITCSRTVKYTAGADGPIVFVQRYGASGGTTTGKNGFISVRQGN